MCLSPTKAALENRRLMRKSTPRTRPATFRACEERSQPSRRSSKDNTENETRPAPAKS
jgi:hypothetical protein